MNRNAIAGQIGRMLRVILDTSKCPVIQISSLYGALLSRKLRAGWKRNQFVKHCICQKKPNLLAISQITVVFWLPFNSESLVCPPDIWKCSYIYTHTHIYTGLFTSPSGNSELDCATTKTDTVERSISIGRESLKVFFCTRGLGVLAGSTARG